MRSPSRFSCLISVYYGALCAFAPIVVVPRSRSNDRGANEGQHNSQGYFCTGREARARVAVERGVARVATGFVGCERASLQAREERIGRVIQDVHRGKCEHRGVVVQRNLT